MDASAYLTRQGWRGRGHALHPAGHGLAHPLLLARKSDHRGVGKPTPNHALADQWWSRALDARLQSLQVAKTEDHHVAEMSVRDEPEENHGRRSRTQEKMASVAREGGGRGLYAFFQKGEPLMGTMRVEEPSPAEPPMSERPRKRARHARSAEQASLEQATKVADVEPTGKATKRRKRRRAEEVMELESSTVMTNDPPGMARSMRKTKEEKKKKKQSRTEKAIDLDESPGGLKGSSTQVSNEETAETWKGSQPRKKSKKRRREGEAKR